MATLLVKGNLEATGYGEVQSILDRYKPIDYIMEWFELRLKAKSPEDRILVLLSGTGTGKSTIIPPEFYHRFYHKIKRNICCTQPRVLTAMEIPNTVLPFHTREALQKRGISSEPLVMGKNIGYQTGPLSSKPVRGVVYMTIGVLLRQLNTMPLDEFMKKYFVIIIDEVHERSVETDMTLYLMKRLIHENYLHPDCPFLVTMSATFDAFKFCDYLLPPLKKNYANIIKVRGFSFPVDERFLESNSANLMSTIIDKVKNIHKTDKDKGKFRDILIFVSGTNEIAPIRQRIEKLNKEDSYFQENPVFVIEITSDVVKIQPPEYQKLFADIETLRWENKKVFRRVIIATNVAETGITIDTLKYVIEPGWYKSAEFNPNFSADLLVTKPVTRDMHTQRRGRVGRKAPGICYSLFTKKTFDSLQVSAFADIIRRDITADVLNLLITYIAKEIGNKFIIAPEIWVKIQETKINLYDIDLLDPPSADSLHHALNKLYTLGYINVNLIPNSLGIFANKFRISLDSLRLILAGYAWKVFIADLITIASFLNVKLPKKFMNSARNKKWYLKFFKTAEYNEEETILLGDLLLNDDFITYLFIFYEFSDQYVSLSEEDMKKWISDNKMEIIMSVIEIREEIIYDFARFGLNPYEYFDFSWELIRNMEINHKIEYIKKIKHCIFDGYRCNIAVQKEGKFYDRRTHLQLTINTNFKYIIYDKIFYKPNNKGIYIPKVENISVLDGYIPFDENFDK
ncbi:MAG: helicase-related protein [Nitrososphaerota archaeon]